MEYIDALQDEHDRMLDIAKQEHCLIKCVITPPTLNWQSTDPESAAAAEQSKQRLNRLKEFLEGSDDALNNIEWAISPYLQPNTHIIGNASCLQGFKRGKQRGYDFTLRYAGAEEVASNCLMYDELFEHLATWTLTTYRVVPQHDRREALRLATLACIKEELGEANHPPDEEKPK